MATGGPDSPTALFLTRGDAPPASPGQDDEAEVSAVNQVATQTQLLEGEADPDVDDVVHQQVQVTSPQQQQQAQVCAGVVNSSDSLSSSPVSATSSDSPGAEHATPSGASTQYIAVTVSAEQAGGVVVTGDTVAHPTYVQYVDDTSPEAATIYATTNGQMAYPVYTMGEATATMYTPAASGQYYTPANQNAATYSQGQGQLLAQAPGAAAYILQQGVDASEAHALITSNRASPPTVSAEAAAAVAAAVGYMVPAGSQPGCPSATATTTNVTNVSAPSPLDEGSDQGAHSNLTHATRVSPATVQWLVENYETAEGVSLPRSTLYNHYLRHCGDHKLEPVNAASFGKLIRSVFIGLRTRRLGTRGNSKYHYYGIRVKPSSTLTHVEESESCSPTSSRPPGGNGALTSTTPTSSPAKRFKSGQNKTEFEGHLGQNHIGAVTNPVPQLPQHHQYLGEASAAIPMFPEIDFAGLELPEDCTYEDVDTLRSIYREHCEAFLDAVTTLEFSTVESLWREFWRSSDNNNGDECEEEKYLSKTKLYLLCKCPPVQQFVRKVDFDFYQNLVEVLIPDVLRPIPSSLTQAIRNFAKGLEGWLTGAMTGCPEAIMNIKLCAVSAFAQTLRRYTSLNHLAQAARAVLQNSTQINQMLADLNRVDFHNVQEQASWVCQCDSDLVQRLEADFKATLQQQNSLEQWAQWLKNVVATVLKPFEGKPNFAKAARQFLLKWSFYSSMVIRDLTLRSAASFGSFHLIRLLYDEYMFYLIEHQVALATGETPIAVIGEKSGGIAELSEPQYEEKSLSMPGLSDFNSGMGLQCNGGGPSSSLIQQATHNGGALKLSPSSGPTLRSDAAKRLKMS